MTSTRTLAENLIIDDRFKFGGGMYRITDVITTSSKMLCILAYDCNNPADEIQIVMQRKSPVKIYNQ